jgi:hypothetical protein
MKRLELLEIELDGLKEKRSQALASKQDAMAADLTDIIVLRERALEEERRLAAPAPGFKGKAF